MENKELISYAVLSGNFDNKRNYLSNFESFVLEVIRKKGLNTVGGKDVQSGLIEYFGLKIPQNIISEILKNLSKNGEYLIKEKINSSSKKFTYKPRFNKIDKAIDIDSKSKAMVTKINELEQEYKKYVKNKFSVELTPEQCSEHIESFVKENNINILLHKPISESETSEVRYKVASFLEEVKSNNAGLYSLFESIVKGNMLSEALYYNDPNELRSKLKDCKFYFDTTFIMYGLGYSGLQRKEPVLELIEMIKKSGARLYCSEQTVIEIINILTWCKYNLNSGRDTHNTISYFRENEIDEDKIDLIISDINHIIQRDLNITVSDFADYSDFSSVIDHQDLSEYLSQNINYSKDESREHDIEAIASIMRFRKNKKSTTLEDAKAVFVTTNNTLCRVTKEYFEGKEEIGEHIIPPVLSDSVVTNLIWLKAPDLSPDLPMKKLAADCFSALNPSDRLWNKYIDNLEKIIAENSEFDHNDIVVLRYHRDAKKILMTQTMGDENAITEGTAREVLREIERQQQKEIIKAREQMVKENEMVLGQEREKHNQKLEQEKNTRIKIETERNTFKENIAVALATAKKDSEKEARLVKNIIYGFIILLLGVGSFLTLDYYATNIYIKVIMSIFMVVILPIVQLISKIFDFEWTSWFEQKEKNLVDFLYIKKCKKRNINNIELE